MVKRIQVSTLKTLCLRGVENLSSYLCYDISNTLVPSDKAKHSEDGDKHTANNVCRSLQAPYPDQTQLIVETFVETWRDLLWSSVVFHCQPQVFKHFLEGIISAIEIMKSKWKLNTKMPEFTLQVWAMTKLSEVLYYKHLKEIDLETIPKMVRGSLIRNLSKFAKLRKLVFGSSTGDMTVHIAMVSINFIGT